MSFQIECPHCQQPLECPDELDGGQQLCPACGMNIDIQKPSANTKSKEKGLSFSSDSSKEQKVFLILISLIALFAIAAFLMIGYLATPLMQEKAVWQQMSQERKDNLLAKLHATEQGKLDLFKQLDGNTITARNKLAAINIEINSLKDKQKQCTLLAKQILDSKKSINDLTEQYMLIEKKEKLKISTAVTVLKKGKNNLSQEIKDYEAKLLNRKNKLKETDIELQNKLSTIAAANKQLAVLQFNAMKATGEIANYKLQKKQFENTSITLQQILKTISSTQESYQKLLDDQNNAVVKLGTFRKSTQTEMNSLSDKKAEVALLNKAIGIQTTTQNKIAVNINDAEFKLKLTEQKKATIDADIKALTTKKATLETEMKQLREKFKQLLSQKDKEKTILETKIEQLHGEFKQFSLNKNKEKKILETEIKQLQDMLKQLHLKKSKTKEVKK
jgi:chromosome segregation ATPase